MFIGKTTGPAKWTIATVWPPTEIRNGKRECPEMVLDG